MICPRCGRELERSDGFCPVCDGAEVTRLPVSDDAPTQMPPGPPVDAQTVVPGSATDPSNTPTIVPGPRQSEPADGLTRTLLTAAGQAQMTLAGGPTVEPAAVGSSAFAEGEAFGARYRIDRLIGKGGMGAVYEVWDAVLDVKVALKVIHPDHLADPLAARRLERRFKRELLLGRRVTHKNVVRIHDIGEILGIKYITMPFIEGDDLSTVMKNAGGKLPVPRALAIARSALSGLFAVHDAGVVHRDLKPANLMVSEGDEAFLTDFGIALATDGTSADEETGEGIGQALAQTPESALIADQTIGGIVGTVPYMAPEQAKGQPIDQRADVYAFGLILYDMLVGRYRADHTPTPVEELTGRMKTAPPAVRTIDPSLPEALGGVISRCLDPDPAERYQTSRELEANLDRLDDEGNLLPIERRISPLQLSAAVASVVALLGTIWWFTYTPPPAVQPDPVSVVIADLDNRTKDAAFDGTLEPMLKRVLEDAGFITAYDRSIIGRLGVPRPDRLDEVAARELAVQQGLGVVLSGSIDPQGSGYSISITATQTVTGEVITSVQDRARSKDQVLEVAMTLIARVRTALGDDTSESAQQFAMASLSATSLDVVGLYAAAMEAQSANRFDEARQHALGAVALDPDFGIGYVVLAVASANLGRADDSQKYVDEALRHLDGMTERERYSTRAYSSWATGDYEQCVTENSDLIALYPADIGGHNQLALCLSHLRDMRRAMEEMQEIVEILPSHPIFRINLAIYANYASDFQTAEQAARAVEGPYGALILAFAQMGQGQVSNARETYERLGQFGALGASLAASGLGDLAAFEGRYSDAVGILTRGAAEDLAAENSDNAAAKFAAVAYAELSRGGTREAIEAAAEALRHSSAVKIRFLAARTFVEAGDIDRARPLIDGLASELYAEPRALAKVLEGVIALRNGDAPEAMSLLREANDLFDTWIGFFDLGRASLAAGACPQADSAFDVCLNARRGEALSLFVDEEPTYAYLPLAYYYQGRARENIGTAGYRDSYRQYLDIRGESTEDPLLPEVRERVEG